MAKYVEKHYPTEERLRKENIEIKKRHEIIPKLMNQTTKLKDLKNGTFISASEYKSDVFKNSIDKLIRINFRETLNVSGTRKIVAGFAEWYSKDNPMLESFYDDNIAKTLKLIADGKGGMTNAELEKLSAVLENIVGVAKKWDKVYKNGKWIDAKIQSQQFTNAVKEAKQFQNGMFYKFGLGKYQMLFGDNASIFRAADAYNEHGFFTEMFN